MTLNFDIGLRIGTRSRSTHSRPAQQTNDSQQQQESNAQHHPSRYIMKSFGSLRSAMAKHPDRGRQTDDIAGDSDERAGKNEEKPFPVAQPAGEGKNVADHEQ